MTLEGRLERKDLGTGVWVLHTSTGEVALYGTIPVALDGATVEVQGERFEGMGIGMTGDPMVQVRKVAKK